MSVFFTLTKRMAAHYHAAVGKNKIQTDTSPSIKSFRKKTGRLFLQYLLYLLIITVVSLITYSNTLRNGFVNWDDDVYIYENLSIRSINLGLLEWSLTASTGAHWHPLTWISFALDYAVWGLDPFGYHLTNVILHSLNTFLVFILASRLIECGVNPTLTLPLYRSGYKSLREREESSLPFKGRVGEGMGSTQNFHLVAASVTALLFGIHPLHVESVAWATERKDVLSAFFFLTSLISYVRYNSAQGRKRFYYGACITLFVAALLTKPMTISLPIVLLLLDFYPLCRLSAKVNIKPLLIEKLPFFILSALSAAMTVWAAHSAGMMETLENVSFTERLTVALWSYIFYLYKMIMPFNLAPLYPYPLEADLLTIKYSGSVVLFLLITLFCFHASKREKMFLTIWLYYIVTLLPAMRTFQAGHHAAADRYTYLPGLGPFLLAGAGAGYLYRNLSEKRYYPAMLTVMAVISLSLAFLTIRQTILWRDSLTLWSYEIKLYPDAYVAYNNLGAVRDRPEEAIKEYLTAIKIRPTFAPAHSNLGEAYLSQGRIEEAIIEFQTALQLKPGLAEAHYNLGVVYMGQGRYDKAMRELMLATKYKPDFALAHNNLGIAYDNLGYLKEAIAEYLTAIEIMPDSPEPHYNLGHIYRRQGLDERAFREFEIVLKLSPGHIATQQAIESLRK